jgi:hypothetical protein
LSDASRETAAQVAERKWRNEQAFRDWGTDEQTALLTVRQIDGEDAERLMLDGVRWRRYWRLQAVLQRAETEAGARRQLAAESSASVRAAWLAAGGCGPSHAELRLHRYPPDGDVAEWVRNGPPGHVNYPGREVSKGTAA